MDYPYNLGSYSRKVTTTSEDAQRWFDRGLNWCFGYHHEEAVACFEKTRERDPNCAMAHWGVAYGVGPNYAKGVAHAALGDVPAAETEQALFREAAKRVPKSRYLHNVPCPQLLAVAEEMLAGEIAYRRGDHNTAFARLRAAIALDGSIAAPWTCS
jgi:hypothetical protein